MRFKVKATYFIDAANWEEAEIQVENNLAEADQIDSEPATKSPTDIITYGIASKISDKHRKIFFGDIDEYEEKSNELKQITLDWLENLMEEVFASNKENWS